MDRPFYWKNQPELYMPYLRRRVRAKRGIGVGQNYVPWIKVRDIPSRGTCTVVLGIKSQRVHHLLSSLETTYFFLKERDPNVVDIREQFPILKISDTLNICAQLQISHGHRRGWPEPVTIDFILTEIQGGRLINRAVSIKTPEDQKDPKTKKRLAIEMRWCTNHGIDWTLAKTDKFSKVLLSNLRFMRAWAANGNEPTKVVAEEFARKFNATYIPNDKLGVILDRCAKALRLKPDMALQRFRYCTWNGSITVALQQEISLNRPFFR